MSFEIINTIDNGTQYRDSIDNIRFACGLTVERLLIGDIFLDVLDLTKGKQILQEDVWYVLQSDQTKPKEQALAGWNAKNVLWLYTYQNASKYTTPKQIYEYCRII
ncbi:hypothetical protein C0J52_03059 [Blattella germanica]|nr:hypothetical protein C0J52_03059 [Blattella germanica]